jgi:hypothetical protein
MVFNRYYLKTFEESPCSFLGYDCQILVFFHPVCPQETAPLKRTLPSASHGIFYDLGRYDLNRSVTVSQYVGRLELVRGEAWKKRERILSIMKI